MQVGLVQVGLLLIDLLLMWGIVLPAVKAAIQPASMCFQRRISYAGSLIKDIGQVVGERPVIPPMLLKQLQELNIARIRKRQSRGGIKRHYHLRTPSVIQSRATEYDGKEIYGLGVNKANLLKVPVFKTNGSLGFLNCQSVRNKTSEIVHYVLDNDFDICALAETWLHADESDNRIISELTPDGYNFTHIPRMSRGGGVGVLLKSSLSFRQINSFKASSFESIELMVTSVSVCIRLITIYHVPPSRKNGLSVTCFMDEFSQLLESLSTASGKLIIIGDINIHWNDQSNSERKKLSDLLDMYNLCQHIDKPTHSKGHTIDLVITRSNESIVTEAEVGSLISDHHTLLCKIQIAKPPPTELVINYHKLKSIKFPKFNEDIVSSSLRTVNCNGPDTLVSNYNKVLKSLLDDHAPLKCKKVAQRPLIKWMNEEILAAKRLRRKYENMWRNSLLTVHKDLYVTQKSHVKQPIDSAKQAFFKDQITECNRDQENCLKLQSHYYFRKQNQSCQLISLWKSLFAILIHFL